MQYTKCNPPLPNPNPTQLHNPIPHSPPFQKGQQAGGGGGLGVWSGVGRVKSKQVHLLPHLSSWLTSGPGPAPTQPAAWHKAWIHTTGLCTSESQYWLVKLFFPLYRRERFSQMAFKKIFRPWAKTLANKSKWTSLAFQYLQKGKKKVWKLAYMFFSWNVFDSYIDIGKLSQYNLLSISCTWSTHYQYHLNLTKTRKQQNILSIPVLTQHVKLARLD